MMPKQIIKSAILLLPIIIFQRTEAGKHKPWKHKNYSKDNFYHLQRRHEHENQLQKQYYRRDLPVFEKMRNDGCEQQLYPKNKYNKRDTNWTKEPGGVMEDMGLDNERNNRPMDDKHVEDGSDGTTRFWASFDKFKQRVSDLREKYGQEDHSWDLAEFQSDVGSLFTCASHVGLESLRVCGDYAHRYLNWIPIEVLKEVLANLILP